MKQINVEKINPHLFRGKVYKIIYQGPAVQVECVDDPTEVKWMPKEVFDLNIASGTFTHIPVIDQSDFLIGMELGQWVAMSQKYNCTGAGITPNEAVNSLQQAIERLK